MVKNSLSCCAEIFEFLSKEIPKLPTKAVHRISQRSYGPDYRSPPQKTRSIYDLYSLMSKKYVIKYQYE